MGAKNHSGVRAEKREGRRVLIIDFRFRDKDGREQRYRRDASVQTATAARAEADRLRRFAIEHGTVDINPPALTLERFVRDQFEPLVMPTYSPATRERYARILSKEGLFAELGRTRLEDIGAREFRLLDTKIRERGARSRQHLSLLRRILREAVQLGFIARMPALPTFRKEPGVLPSAPSIEIVSRLLVAAGEGWLRTAIALAFYAGQRCGEVLALRVTDIDLTTKTLHIRQALSHDQIWTPKGREERAVPIATPLLEILAIVSNGKGPADLLVSKPGMRITRQALYKRFVSLQKKAGISPQWSFHALRHAFGTHAVRSGGNIAAIRELMGHKDLETTTRYLHAVADDKRSVIRMFDGQPRGNE